MVLTDYFGKEYQLGDYVYAVINSHGGVETFIGKVCGIGQFALTVVRFKKHSFSDKLFYKVVLQKPARDIIIPEKDALLISPRLAEYSIVVLEYAHYDTVGVKYKINDIVFVAQHYGNSSVRTYFAKVVKINPESISIIKNSNSNCMWGTNELETSVLRVPSRHLIVNKELAAWVEPQFRAK